MAKAFKATKQGRPPKAGVDRYGINGRIVTAQCKPPETEEQIQATVIAYRRKLGVPEKEVRNQKGSTIVGVLHLTEEITNRQYAAAERFFGVVDRFYGIQGFTKPWATPEPGPTRGDPPEEVTNRVRRDHSDMMSRLLDLEQSAVYRGTYRALFDLIMLNRDVRRDPPALGNVRSGLNVLIRLWQMQD